MALFPALLFFIVRLFMCTTANLVFHNSEFFSGKNLKFFEKKSKMSNISNFAVEFDSDCMKAMCFADSGCEQQVYCTVCPHYRIFPIVPYFRENTVFSLH